MNILVKNILIVIITGELTWMLWQKHKLSQNVRNTNEWTLSNDGELYLYKKNASSLDRQKAEAQDWEYKAENRSDIRTVIFWANIKNHVLQDFTSSHHCPNHINGSCVFTSDRRNYKAAHGIIFHIWPSSWNGSAPAERFLWQHYIAFTGEPAEHKSYKNNYNRIILPTVSRPGFFNLTSTFRSDSDFPLPYFHTQFRDRPCDHCLPNSTFLFNKTKLMAWIVSNCKTQSKREDYMTELSKYIKVDVFGKCGNFTPECDSLWQSSCTNNMMQGYKFYFAAENSICKDYFTEKFYRALETNVVPVVYSAAGIHKVAPPHSYIDVRDFKSPKYLAQYLIYLDKNDYEYLSYFSWRKHFKCKEVNRSVKKVFCDLCQYLFEDNRPKVVQNFTKWFFKDAGCKSFPKQF